MTRRGRLTGSRVEIPADRLSPSRLFSGAARLLTPEEVFEWNRANASVLDLYGLRLTACRSLRLRRPSSPPRGILETDHRERLIATACLAALAVAGTGRGALLDLPPGARQGAVKGLKERNDRAATCAMAEGIFALAEALPGGVCEIAIGEGMRLKHGEKGGNPTLYVGQVLGDPKSAALTRAERAARGIRTYSMAVDTVDGTTKSTVADPSSVSLFFITESEIHRVPDVYFNKCQILGVDGVHVDSALKDILEAVAAARGTEEINVFALDRPRHPLQAMVEMGASVRTDTDGDVLPVVAAGLGWGVFPDNGRPLDGVCGNVGGAAEVVASAAAGHYLGVRSTARFAAKKIARWEERYDLGPGEADAIRSVGFDPERVYGTADLVPDIGGADGAFVASAITGNIHVPLLDAVFWGGNFAEVSVVFVGASGAADLHRLTFAYRTDAVEARAALTPIMETILTRPAAGMGLALRAALGSPTSARRLRHEFATSYYSHFTEIDGRFRLDMKSAEAVEPESSLAFLRAVAEAAPEWFA